MKIKCDYIPIIYQNSIIPTAVAFGIFLLERTFMLGFINPLSSRHIKGG